MTASSSRPPIRRVVGAPWVVLVGGLLGLAFLGTLPWVEGIGLGLAGGVVGALLRTSRSPGLRALAPLGPLAALAGLAVEAIPSALPALYGGAVALALLLWLSDDPDRLPGGPTRALGRLVVPAAGLALAWTSSFLLPGGVVSVGVAAALLGGVLVLVAFVLRAPNEFAAGSASS